MSTARNAWAMSWVLICLTILGLMAGCDGEGIGSNFATAPTSTQQVTDSSTDAVNRVLELMLGNSADLTTGATPKETQGLLRVAQPHLLAKQGDIEISLSCGSGSVVLRGNVETTHAETSGASEVPFTLSATVNFAQCEGMDGTLTLASDGSLGGNRIVYVMALSGTVQANTCSITFDQFAVNIEANASGLLIAPLMVHGSTNASCEEATVACKLSNIDLDDVEMFESSCTQT